MADVECSMHLNWLFDFDNETKDEIYVSTIKETDHTTLHYDLNKSIFLNLDTPAYCHDQVYAQSEDIEVLELDNDEEQSLFKEHAKETSFHIIDGSNGISLTEEELNQDISCIQAEDVYISDCFKLSTSLQVINSSDDSCVPVVPSVCEREQDTRLDYSFYENQKDFGKFTSYVESIDYSNPHQVAKHLDENCVPVSPIVDCKQDPFIYDNSFYGNENKLDNCQSDKICFDINAYSTHSKSPLSFEVNDESCVPMKPVNEVIEFSGNREELIEETFIWDSIVYGNDQDPEDYYTEEKLLSLGANGKSSSSMGDWRECLSCEFKTLNDVEFFDHSKVHECLVKLSCTKCKFQCYQKDVFENHMKEHLNDGRLLCPECPYSTKNKRLFKIHTQRHNGDKPFRCDLCGYGTVVGSALSCHLRRHYGIKPYKCKFCTYKSSEKSALVRHMHRHNDYKPHTCHLCNYKTIQKGCLKKHLLTHRSGKKRIRKSVISRCQICKFETSVRKEFLSHILIHEIYYKCPYCQYKTPTMAHLSRHIRRHKGTKPFFCFLCNYRAIQFVGLRSHLHKHDGVINSCRFCTFKTSFAAKMDIHLKNFHKKEWKVKHTYFCSSCKFSTDVKEILEAHVDMEKKLAMVEPQKKV